MPPRSSGLNSQSLANAATDWLEQPYVTLLLMFVAAFCLMAIVGGPMIRWLKALKGMKWSAREDTPDTHLQKHGTPSMGGIGIVGCMLFALVSVMAALYMTALAAHGTGILLYFPTFLQHLFVLPLYVTAHAGLGLLDDWSKATGRGGLRARSKFLGQCLLSVLFLLAVFYLMKPYISSGESIILGNPYRTSHFPITLLVASLIVLVLLVGTCNAVNITDGIDGLAAGLCVQVGLYLMLAVPLTNGTYSVVTWSALAGACFGFLFFNRYPAKVFMGDTGSLALGAALGGAAVMTHTVFLLPFIGFIFYVELLSVTSQVLYFKWTRKTTGEGKRLFRRAPLHHHFELGGWSEWRVVLTFWAINLVTSAIGLVLWNQGMLPQFP